MRRVLRLHVVRTEQDEHLVFGGHATPERARITDTVARTRTRVALRVAAVAGLADVACGAAGGDEARAAEGKAEAPKDVPRDIPKAALPAIVPVKENISRRDPFSPLLTKEASGNGTPLNLPPGKPGLMIGSLHIDGIVNGPNGMIAIVSNPQQRVYFLREGDHLYDGQVEHITMDGISFHQTGKDPFGNAVEREVAKRLNPINPGEAQ